MTMDCIKLKRLPKKLSKQMLSFYIQKNIPHKYQNFHPNKKILISLILKIFNLLFSIYQIIFSFFISKITSFNFEQNGVGLKLNSF